MKILSVLAVVIALLTSASQAVAVTWHAVTISVKVSQSGATIATTILNTKKYLDKGISQSAAALGAADSDATHYFVGMRDDTGEVAVVHFPTQTKVYNIVSGVTLRGAAFNGAATSGTGAATATISSLNTDFTGGYFDKVVQKLTNGTLKVQSVSRQVFGGSGNQTLSGTIRTTPKTFTF